jgi:glutaconyl-CoA/methylmalonyl-CoA decarboxylase subunit gamma
VKTFKVTVDGQTYTVQVEEVAQNNNPRALCCSHLCSTGKADSCSSAEVKPAANDKPQETQKPVTGGGTNVNAPMPGSVLEVKVSVGDSVNEGDVLVILEAMKMENELTASQAGTVGQVLVKKGDTVNSGDPLIVLT